MKTDDLIATLAADTTPLASVSARLRQALVPAVAGSAVALVLLWQVRDNLAEALASPAVIKSLAPAALALAALWLAHGLSQPEGKARAPLGLVLALGLAAVTAVAVGLAQGGLDALTMHAPKPTLITCIVSIPVLSVLPMAAILWAMRQGAPANPGAAGLAAGLAGGALGAMVYSLHCPEDALLFFVPAYGTMVLVMMGAGGLLGRRLLRW